MISPFKEVPVQVEAAQQWRNGVGRAHSSRDGSAISSIPLPADAALMTGGLEWRGACRHLRPRQIRTGIGSTAEPGSRLGLGASTSTRDVGMPFAVMCPFPTSTFSLVNINALGVQSTRPPLIHRAPHTSHSGFHVYCMAQALGERRQVVQGDRAECDGVKRHRLLPSMVLANRFQGSGTAPFSTRSPPRWPAACVHWFPCNAPHYGNTNRQVPAAPRMGNDCCTPKREGDCHEVFHDWWLEDRPALNLFESLEPHDTVEIEGLGGARPEALNVGLDAWDLMPLSETRVVEWFHNHDVGSPANGTSKADDSVPSLDMPSF